MSDQQKFMEAYDMLANLAKKNPLMSKLWTDAQITLLKEAKEIYFALKNEAADDSKAKVQTVAYSTNTDKDKNIKIWELTQEEKATLSKLVQLLIEAKSLKVPADIILDDHGAGRGVSTIGQKKVIDSLNNVLLEIKTCYEELQKMLQDKGILYFISNPAEIGFANNEEVKILEKLSKNMPELKKYFNGELYEYYSNFLLEHPSDDTSIIAMPEIEFDSNWVICEKYYIQFSELQKAYVGKKVVMDKSDFAELLNWQENIRRITVFLDKHLEYPGRADKLAKVADMNFLIERNLLNNLELIPVRGFSEKEKIEATNYKDVNLPSLSSSDLFKYISYKHLSYRAVVTVVYYKLDEPEGKLYKGGRFVLSKTSDFPVITLPPKSKGIIEFSLYYSYEENWMVPIGSGFSDDVTTKGIIGGQEETTTFTVEFETNTVAMDFETPTEPKVDTHAIPNSYAKIAGVKPQVIQNVKGNSLVVDAIMVFSKDTFSRNQGFSAIVSAGLEQSYEQAEGNPWTVFTLNAPFALEGSTYLGGNQEYDKPRIETEIKNLGSVKVFYEKGKYETKHQTQTSQDALKEWLDKLANNEILVDALNEKVLFVRIDGYASAEGNDDMMLAKKRKDTIKILVEEKILDKKFEIKTTAQVHPDSKRTDDEKTHKQHRYVEIKLEWNN